MKVRLATLDDISGIVEVYRSDKKVEPWYKWIERKKIEDTLDNLSVYQQFMN